MARRRTALGDMEYSTCRHWALIAYLVLVWGFAFALIAVALESFHPLFIVWCRQQRWCLGREWWPKLILLSLTGNIIPFSLIAWAEQSVPSAEVGILMALMPIATLVLAHWLLVHEPLTWRRFAGVVLGFAGVALLVGDELLSAGASGQWRGQLAVLMATVSYAFNGVYVKRLPTQEPVLLSVGTLVIGCVLLAVPALWAQFSGPGFVATARATIVLVVLGVMATGVATWCYFVVVTERGPGFLSTINYLIPAVAFVAGTLFLAEPWGWGHLIALGMILVGVGLIQVRQAR